MRRLLLGLAAALTLLTTPAPVSAAPPAEDHLRDWMARLEAPGAAYAVVRGDEVVRRGAWGVDGDGRPMTTQTPFLLGSTSKSFTALAVAQLAEAGRVGLDTPAATYLPWLGTARDATVRQLLTHTSGLPEVASTGLTDRYDGSPGGLARSVRDLAGLRPTAAPGQRYEYSDANYMILGALVEGVTGDTFGAYLRRHVLDPLHMTHAAATADEARAAGVPAGHRYYLGRPQSFAMPFDTAGVPYGFLAASLDDLTHYAVAQLNGGSYAGTRLLGAAATAQMHAGTADTGHGTYGFGWQDSTLDGTGARIVWHAGATPDYFTHIVLVPGSDLAVIVMTNVYNLSKDPLLSAAAFNLARIELGATPAPAAADPLHNAVLAVLLGTALALLAALGRAWWRPSRSRRRVAAWVCGCAAVAAGAAWGVPALWHGAGLAKVRLWAPDIGDAVVVVVALAAAVALSRLFTTFIRTGSVSASAPSANPCRGTALPRPPG